SAAAAGSTAAIRPGPGLGRAEHPASKPTVKRTDSMRIREAMTFRTRKAASRRGPAAVDRQGSTDADLQRRDVVRRSMEQRIIVLWRSADYGQRQLLVAPSELLAQAREERRPTRIRGDAT